MDKKFYIILAAFIVVFLEGCHRSTSTSSSAKDSTEIKRIEEMQKRGSDYRNSSDFQRAIATHDSCIQLAEKINDTIQLVIALNNQGTNYRRLSANKEAADYHFRALQLCDAYPDTTTFLAKKNRVRSLNGLGNVMLSLGNYEAAENAFHKALDGETRLSSATGQAINLANIGSIKEHAGDVDSARIYYNRSMEKNREGDNKIGISLCYSYLGELDKKSGHLSDALANFRQAYAVGSTTGDVWHELVPCLSLAEIYTDQNNVDSATLYINKGIEAAKEIHSNEHLRDFYAIRSRLEEKQGRVAQALADLRLCTAYNDSVLTEEERSSIQNARADYESGRRSVEVKAANDEAETSRVIRNAVAITAFLIVAFMIMAFLEYRRYVRMRHKAEHEREVFMRNIAHQLRTPMTVVSGMVDQLRNHIPSDDAIGIEDLEATQRQTRQLQNLILQLARMPKSEVSPLLSETADIAQNNITPLAFRRGAGDEASGGGSVLLAEDNEDVAKMISGLLRENGYSVNCASDGQLALDILQQSELPDLLITDIAMPRMDGLELMRRVRQDDTMCHLPIIVASARVEDSERLEGIHAGAEVYLTKPFLPQELLLRVRTMLEQRERLRRSFSNLADVEEKPDMTAAEGEFVDKLNKIIDDNMSSGAVIVNTVADKLCASVSTVNRKVKNITGMSCSEYIQNRRLELAKHLLLADTSLTVAEIARMCGFDEPTHFNRFFKNLTGHTPGEFRKYR